MILGVNFRESDNAERKAVKAINRRFTQMDTDKDFIKNFTAETQSTLRQEFLPNRETTIEQKARFLRESCFCLSSSPDKQKRISLRPLR